MQKAVTGSHMIECYLNHKIVKIVEGTAADMPECSWPCFESTCVYNSTRYVSIKSKKGILGCFYFIVVIIILGGFCG